LFGVFTNKHPHPKKIAQLGDCVLTTGGENDGLYFLCGFQPPGCWALAAEKNRLLSTYISTWNLPNTTPNWRQVGEKITIGAGVRLCLK